jgi:hypothetical protein
MRVNEITRFARRSMCASNVRLLTRSNTMANAWRRNAAPGVNDRTSAFGGSSSVTVGNSSSGPRPASPRPASSCSSCCARTNRTAVAISAAVSGSSGCSGPGSSGCGGADSSGCCGAGDVWARALVWARTTDPLCANICASTKSVKREITMRGCFVNMSQILGRARTCCNHLHGSAWFGRILPRAGCHPIAADGAGGLAECGSGGGPRPDGSRALANGMRSFVASVVSIAST